MRVGSFTGRSVLVHVSVGCVLPLRIPVHARTKARGGLVVPCLVSPSQFEYGYRRTYAYCAQGTTYCIVIWITLTLTRPNPRMCPLLGVVLHVCCGWSQPCDVCDMRMRMRRENALEMNVNVTCSRMSESGDLSLLSLSRIDLFVFIRTNYHYITTKLCRSCRVVRRARRCTKGRSDTMCFVLNPTRNVKSLSY